jgi:hypothetical protein
MAGDGRALEKPMVRNLLLAAVVLALVSGAAGCDRASKTVTINFKAAKS